MIEDYKSIAQFLGKAFAVGHKIEIRSIPVQQQKSGSGDCGFFSLLFGFHLTTSVDPVTRDFFPGYSIREVMTEMVLNFSNTGSSSKNINKIFEYTTNSVISIPVHCNAVQVERSKEGEDWEITRGIENIIDG